MEKNTEFGPAKISFPTFILKLLAGGSGGAVGSLILVVIFILSGSLFAPLTEGSLSEAYISPIFIFILMMMIFLSSTAGNILSTLLLALTERDKYSRISTSIYQVFIVSVLIFVLMVPVYFIAAAVNMSIIPFAVALHIVVSAQLSAFILEIVSNYRYALVGAYGITFSIILSAAIIFILSGIVVSPAILLFLSLPIVWGSIAFTYSVTTMIYGFIVRTYDKDFLSTQTVYGNDFGKDVEVEEQKQPRIKDSTGGDFLRNTK